MSARCRTVLPANRFRREHVLACDVAACGQPRFVDGFTHGEIAVIPDVIAAVSDRNKEMGAAEKRHVFLFILEKLPLNRRDDRRRIRAG